MMRRAALIGAAAVAGISVAGTSVAGCGAPPALKHACAGGSAAAPCGGIHHHANSTTAPAVNGPDAAVNPSVVPSGTNPKTGPPILIPGRLVGAAPPDAPLRLALILEPGTAESARQQVARVLAAAGFTVTASLPGEVHFTGTAAKVAGFFDVHLQGYRLPDGALEVVAATTPRPPASISASVSSVTGFFLPGQRQSGGRG